MLFRSWTVALCRRAEGQYRTARPVEKGKPSVILDGEVTPTVQYTGTEDYFCGSFQFGSETVKGRYYMGLADWSFTIFQRPVTIPLR